MALVYVNLKGMFKEGTSTSEPKNQSGIMAKQLDALSGTGPEGHSLADITPEEEKLLQKATGKETMTTAYGIPTYETDLTADEMEDNLRKAGMYDYDNLINQAMDLAKENKDNTDLQKLFDAGKITIQEYDDKLTQRSADAINLHYADLLKQRHGELQEIEDANIIKQTGKVIGKGVEKVKSFFNKPEKTEGELSKSEFNPDRDYHLNKFLLERQEEMKSKEPYFPPQP